MFKKLVHNTIAFLFLFFFMFSNLLTRISQIDFNGLYYVILPILILFSIRSLRSVLPDVLISGMILLAISYAFFDTSSALAGAFVVKDFVLPMAAFLVGKIIFLQSGFFLNSLNLLFAPYIIYGVAQITLIHLNVVGFVLPWDIEFVTQNVQEISRLNYFRGHMLRPFGTMNSFVEFQIAAVILLSLLWLHKKQLQYGKLFNLNFVLTMIFMVLSLERSAVGMLFILLLIWKHRLIFGTLKRMLAICAVVSVLVVGVVFVDSAYKPESNPLYGEQYKTVKNILTLNFEEDEALRGRQEVMWNEAIEMFLDSPLGIGVERLSTSLNRTNIILPHNGFIAQSLAFGYAGGIALIMFIIVMWVTCSRLKEDEYRFYGYAFLVGFSLMAIVNMPFISRLGVLFFMISGWLCGKYESSLLKVKLMPGLIYKCACQNGTRLRPLNR